MKTTKRSKIFALLCALVLMISMCSVFALAAGTNPITVNGEKYDNDKTAPEKYDISVMSYNILESGSGSYDYPDQRLADVVTNIMVYEPDIIGVQEASDSYVAASYDTNGEKTFVWSTKLTEKLEDKGYTAIKLNGSDYAESYQITSDGSKTSIAAPTTSIGNGLIIFYKDDKVTAGKKYRYNFKVTAGGYSNTTRWFQCVQFTDQSGRPFYFYNTHFATNEEDRQYNDYNVGYYYRTQQTQILFNDINARAKNYPFFAAGDYNTRWSDMNHWTSDDVAHFKYITSIGYNSYVSDAGLEADVSITSRARSRIDHIFINDDYVKAIEFRAINENVEGRGMSDHMALVSYCNFAAEATINDKAYDEVNQTFTNTTDSAKFTFNIADTTQAKNLTWTINGSTANTVTLAKATNTFDIDFSANGKVLNTVRATIQYTGAKTATVAATGTINTYFANDGYHLLYPANTTSTKIKVTGGTLYKGATAPQASPCTVPVTAGRNSGYTVVTDAGDTYPVYLYQATATAESGNVIYVDDDMPTSGTGAFYNGTDVIYTTAGTNGFATIDDAAAICANTAGYTIYVAPGSYTGNTNHSFHKGITLLGANAGVSALKSDSAKTLNTDRVEESIIEDGRIIAYTSASDYKYTISGFTFAGLIPSDLHGHIYLATDNSLTTSTKVKSVLNVDISDNIFTSYGDENNDAHIFLNSGIQVSGVIADNYFKYNGNASDKDENNYITPSNTRENRAMQIRNLNGLTIENNRFINFPVAMLLSSEYATAESDYDGYANYTVQNNNFEACDYINNYLRNIDSTGFDIRYYNNNFIRCGYYLIDKADGNDYAPIYLDIGKTTVLSNASVAIQGNNFLGCIRSIKISRSQKEMGMGNMADITVNINRNRFYRPQERNTQKTYLDDAITFDFLVNDSFEFGVDVSNKWSLAYNYFYSDIFSTDSADNTYHVYTDGKSVNDPTLYITNSTTYNSTSGNSIALNKSFYAPYYTNVEMTTLSSGNLLTQSGISADNVNVTYDGAAHGITVNGAANNSTITYSTDGKIYSSVNPTFTEVGSYTVYYMVETPAYAAFSGSATVKINAVETVLPEQTGISAENVEVTYDGKEHSITVKGITDDCKVTYSTDGATYNETNPVFTNVNTDPYTVYYKVERDGYVPYLGTATVTITPADLAVDISGYEGYYDGNKHGVTVGEYPEGVTATYTVDGKDVTAPTYDKPGTYSVTVTLSDTNYVTRSETVTINIVPAIITGITITPYVGEVNEQSHGVTVEGTQAGDEVYYAYGGGDYTTTEPAFTEEGIYSVTVKITRENYQDKISVVTVVIDESEKADYIEPLFFVKNDNFGVTQAANGKYTFNWTCELKFTEFGEAKLNDDTYRVLSYGVKYAPSLEYLEEYVYRYQAYGFDEKATGDTAVNGKISGEVAEIAVETASASGNNPGLTNLYQTTKYNLNSLSEVRARYAMSYVRYYKVGDPNTVYEEYGAIEIAISNYLPNGTMKGIGGTEEREDILGTNPNEGETSEREDILGK